MKLQKIKLTFLNSFRGNIEGKIGSIKIKGLIEF